MDIVWGLGPGCCVKVLSETLWALRAFAFQLWVLSGLGLGPGRAGLPAGALRKGADSRQLGFHGGEVFLLHSMPEFLYALRVIPCAL